MRLFELDAEFVRLLHTDGSGSFTACHSIELADGVRFLCPKCFKANRNSPIGVHSILCWKPSVAMSIFPRNGRWSQSGTSLHDLTLTATSSSIRVVGGCEAHFSVKKGDIVFEP